jgi:hypothetical protein
MFNSQAIESGADSTTASCRRSNKVSAV